MTNIKFITTSEEPTLKTIALRTSNLWTEPCTKREELDFWIERLRFKKIPFVMVQYDTELRNSENQKMSRRVYGIFVDMKAWENHNGR